MRSPIYIYSEKEFETFNFRFPPKPFDPLQCLEAFFRLYKTYLYFDELNQIGLSLALSSQSSG